MKRPFLFLFFLILVSEALALDIKFLGGAGLSSYSIYPRKPYWGWVGEHNRYDASYRPGFLLGAGIELPLARHVAVEIDALFFRKGSRITESSLYDLFSKTDYVLDVISLPVLIKIKALPDSSPYLVHGGELSYTLAHKYTTTVYPDPYSDFWPKDYPTWDLKDSTRTVSLGVVVGAGWEIKIRKISVLVEARYHFGLVNILSEDRSDNGILESIKPNSQVILGALKF